MLRFLASFLVVYGGLFAWGLYAEGDFLGSRHKGVLWLATLLMALPGACAWMVAEGVDRWLPRKAFDPRVKKPWTLLFAGLSAGVLSVVIATPLVALLGWLDDGLAITVASMAGALIALLAMGRKRAGECVHCGYDLSAAVDARCTECGAMYSASGAGVPRGA